MSAVRVRVTGRVQGVAFRFYAQQEASRLGLVGWVRNEPDGSVTAHVEGPDGRVDAMVAWCRQGPPAARVEDVATSPAEPSAAASFEVTY